MARYGSDYRLREIRLICRLARRGQSLALLGLAGVGKSNLIAVLGDEARTAPHLVEARRHIHFVPVDMTIWERTPHHLWELMYGSLISVCKSGEPSSGSRIVPIDPGERALARLTARLASVCQKADEQVVFIFDDVDSLLAAGPFPMLEQLSSLRSQGNRERLSYLLFTKRLPHVLGRHLQLESRSKFYDLFRHHIYALGPYSKEDAQQMALHLNENQGRPLNTGDLSRVAALSGGHGGLLKVLFSQFVERQTAARADLDTIASWVDVQQECRRLLRGLHASERRVALAIAEDRVAAADRGHIDHLRRRGIFTGSDPLHWFTPILPHYLRRHGIDHLNEERGRD